MRQSDPNKYHRPQSSKPISTIIIDQIQSNPDYEYGNTSSQQFQDKKNKSKLNNIVPQLPQFGIKSNSTALLYSKFIVKGLKQDKLSIVRNAYKKKQDIGHTEATTVVSKNRGYSAKSYTRVEGCIVEEDVCEADQNNIHFNLNVNTNANANSLMRASSAKVFRKPISKQYINQWQKERSLSKNNTQSNLLTLSNSKTKRRPTTAKIPRGNSVRWSHGYNFEEDKKYNRDTFELKEKNRETGQIQEKEEGTDGQKVQEKKRVRPSTAKNQGVKGRHLEINMYSGDEIANIINNKLKDKPIKIQSLKGIDHIQKNIQNISSYSRKTSSIYLTNTNVENLIKKCEASKQKSPQPQQTFSTQAPILPSQIVQLQPQPQQIFKKQDKNAYQKNLYKIQSYLSQQMPNKFELISEQHRKQHKKATVHYAAPVQENYQQLLSIDLDNKKQSKFQEITEQSAKACFEDYIQCCQILQFKIGARLKSQQSQNGSGTTLNVCQCQRIIEVYKEYRGSNDTERRNQIIQEIKKITKNLKYFSHKPQQQLSKFFSIPFEISIVNQEQPIIQLNSAVSHIYIILNGSVQIESNTTQDSTSLSHRFQQKLSMNQQHHSLYDGDMFGQPAKPSDRFYKFRVVALQQSLLMKVRYEDYTSMFFQGLEVEEKLAVLKIVFQMELNRSLLKQEDLEIISLSLEKQKFASKSLIFRQDEIFDKLVLVGKGKLTAINQYILDQDKILQQDMKLIAKSIKNQKQNAKNIFSKKTNNFIQAYKETNTPIQTLSVSQMRRQNLINNEILRQDNQKIQYYYIKQQQNYIKGDAVNWETILSTQNFHNNRRTEDNLFAILCDNVQNTVKYSLMSNSDDTEVYFLSKGAFNYLPNNIKKVLINKGKQSVKKIVKVESEKQIKQWKNYKSKLCNSIIKEKRQRSSRNHF